MFLNALVTLLPVASLIQTKSNSVAWARSSPECWSVFFWVLGRLVYDSSRTSFCPNSVSQHFIMANLVSELIAPSLAKNIARTVSDNNYVMPWPLVVDRTWNQSKTQRASKAQACFRSHSGTPILKTEDFSKKSVVLVKAKVDLLKPPPPGQKTLEK